MKKILSLYYKITGLLPRALPTSQAEYEELKMVLKEYYGVPDNPRVWMLVAGHITSTPGIKLRKPLIHIANACKRIDINELANNNKLEAVRELQRQFEEKAKQVAEDFQKEELKEEALEKTEEITESLDSLH